MAPLKYTNRVQAKLRTHHDERFQHELKELQETHDLRNIDDDVEDATTLFEWFAPEHNHRPKSARWFIVLAVGATVFAGLLIIFFANFIGALAIIALSAWLYHIAQKKPQVMRYRLLVEGIALNNLFYHYKDLAAFNIVYEPGHTKTVIFRSHRKFSPLLHMEVGEANPILIRDILLEFLHEDQSLEEPFVDLLARRLGF